MSDEAEETAADASSSADEGFEGVRGLLAQISSPRPASDRNNRETYRRKLRTFTATAYFAKPIEISPILCALAGWEIAPGQTNDRLESSVILKCSDCQADLAILIPPGLSASSIKKLAAHYQKQLWEAHSVACVRRKEAEYFIRTALQQNKRMIMPSLVARVLPASSLELLEQSNPWTAFEQRIVKLIPYVQTLGETIVGPDDLLQVVGLVVEKLRKCDDSEYLALTQPRPDAQTTTAAAALVLTGWDLSESREDGDDGEGSSNSVAAIECSFCLSCQALVRSNPVSQEEPQRKRRHTSKWNHPVDAHRYYCPWICGMASASESSTASAAPFWRLLADKLLSDHEVEGSDGTDTAVSATEIHKLLKAGVSSRRMNKDPKRNTTID